MLTPAARPPDSAAAVLTVGSVGHVHALAGWPGRVVVKLASSVRRFGATAETLAPVMTAARAAGLDVIGFSVHPPVAGSDDEHLDDVEPLGRRCSIPPTRCGSATCRRRPTATCATPGRSAASGPASAPPCGTATSVRCTSPPTSLDVRDVRAGEHAGYRQGVVPADGTLVMVGAGTAHGVHPLEDGRSPFHFARRRLDAARTAAHAHVDGVRADR